MKNSINLTISVLWKRNQTYRNYSAAAVFDGKKIGYASGAGYDKQQAALFDALRTLNVIPEAEAPDYKKDVYLALERAGIRYTRTPLGRNGCHGFEITLTR